MLVYLRDGSAQTVAWCCNTKIEVVNQPFHLAQSNNILAMGQPVPELTLKRKTPGRIATGVPILKSLV